MKKQFIIFSLLAISLSACQNDTSTTTATTTDTSAMAPSADPNMVTTTTTTTTTRPVFAPKPDVKYMDLRTHKLITVRVDTIHHYIINTQTLQPVDFIVEPGTTDTFYGRNMQMANGAINYGSGADWTYDDRMTSTGTGTNTTMDSNTSMDAGTSTSTDASDVSKIKSNGRETKVKMTDGSKMKTNGKETKIKMK